MSPPRRLSQAKPPPSPQHSFTIPSLHDSLLLDCRIYAPEGAEGLRDPEAMGGLGVGKDGLMRAAIIAHPYAPTGGCYDDRVVLACVEVLLANGWIVGTFNFRGVKGSKGSTSWTAKPEVADYRSMAGLLVRYLTCLARGRTSDAAALEIELILGGYSYGSMIVSQLGDIAALLEPFQVPAEGSAAEQITLRAADLAAQTLTVERTGVAADGLPSYNTVVTGGADTPVKHASIHATGPLPPVKPAYLLVSPLLPPIAGMLGLSVPAVPKVLKSLFRKAPAEGDAAAAEDVELGMDSPLFTRNPTFAIFGSEESFTSAKKLASWAERLAAASPVRAGSVSDRKASVTPRLFQWDVVEDAGHFWRESSVEGILKSKVRAWAAGL